MERRICATQKTPAASPVEDPEAIESLLLENRLRPRFLELQDATDRKGRDIPHLTATRMWDVQRHSPRSSAA
jgi:hypothetical protein